MTLSRKRFYSTGALGNGTLHCRFHDTVSTGNFIDFLISTYPEYGKFVTFLDNAACHKSRKIKEFPKAMNGGIIAYCPSCAPELNPAGVEWKSFRKAVWNRLYGAQKRCKNP